MKTLIIMYPTMERAVMAWNETCSKYSSLIRKAYRNPLRIKLINDSEWLFKSEHEGLRAIRGFHAEIISGQYFSIDDRMGEEFAD